jgi:hypothetical protein
MNRRDFVRRALGFASGAAAVAVAPSLLSGQSAGLDVARWASSTVFTIVGRPGDNWQNYTFEYYPKPQVTELQALITRLWAKMEKQQPIGLFSYQKDFLEKLRAAELRHQSIVCPSLLARPALTVLD